MMWDEHKKCYHCGYWKPLAEYTKGKAGKRNICRACDGLGAARRKLVRPTADLLLALEVGDFAAAKRLAYGIDAIVNNRDEG